MSEPSNTEVNKTDLPPENQQPEAHLETDAVDYFAADDLQPEEIDTKEPPKIKELLASPDSPSRFMTMLSITFGVLAFICMIMLTYTIIMNKRNSKHHETPVEHEKVVNEPVIQELIGYYQVILKPESSQAHDQELRIDIVAECTTQAACASVKTKIIEIRDLVNPILSSVTREELLSVEGKTRVRRRITEQLNGIVEGGKIIETRFTNMSIESGK